MRNLLTLVCLFILTVASAQEITIKKGKFYKKETQISTWETKQLMITNPEAYKYFKSHFNHGYKQNFNAKRNSLPGFCIATDVYRTRNNSQLV